MTEETYVVRFLLPLQVKVGLIKAAKEERRKLATLCQIAVQDWLRDPKRHLPPDEAPRSGPSPSIGIRVTEGERHHLEEIAHHTGLSVSALLARVMAQFLQQRLSRAKTPATPTPAPSRARRPAVVEDEQPVATGRKRRSNAIWNWGNAS